MSSSKNIQKILDTNFENNHYLPKQLLLEDLDAGAKKFIDDLNVSVEDKSGNLKRVPLIYLTQERWAEFKVNWQDLKDESGEEIAMPFMTIRRTNVKRRQNPIRYTIPNKKVFTFVKVPIFDGTLKGYDIYKIPQPVWVDTMYELRFFTHYMVDVNKSYETIIINGFSNGQGYMNINGYYVPMTLGDPTEENTMDDISVDRKYQIIFPLTLQGKLVDPSSFEKKSAITKVQINIKEG